MLNPIKKAVKSLSIPKNSGTGNFQWSTMLKRLA